MPKATPFIELETVGFKELRRRLNRTPELMYGAALTALRRIGKLLVPQVKAQTPVGATGRLRNYTVFQVLGKKEDLRMEIRQSAFSPGGFPYGVAVRQGTRPHFPPIDALIPWVMRKLGIMEPKQARVVAFLIARKISKVGTKANPYHDRVFAANMGRIKTIINQEIVNMIAKLERS